MMLLCLNFLIAMLLLSCNNINGWRHPPPSSLRRLPYTIRGGDNDSSLSSTSLSIGLDVPRKIPHVEFPESAMMQPYQGQQHRPTVTKVLLLMDSFCDVHGLFLARRAREMYGIVVVPVYSNYMAGYFRLQHHRGDAPENIQELLAMCMPSSMEETHEWCKLLEEQLLTAVAMGDDGIDTLASIDCDTNENFLTTKYEIVALVCDSDSGLADAEQLADWLNVTTRNPGGVCENRRNKYLMIESVKDAGMGTVKQRLCTSREVAIEFATSLLLSSADRVVLKPIRGCGSDDVHLCNSIDSVSTAFDTIYGSSIFGSPGQNHDTVLIQEFAQGQEYAIDTVSRDGELKIVAIWKYDKRPANGAPFVYYATKLFDDSESSTESICPMLYDYLNRCFQALDIRWGITHSEIIVTADGPRLVEINCRQHNMDFLLLTMGGIGYNIYDVLLAAYFGNINHDDVKDDDDNNAKKQLDWDLIPHIPSIRMNAAMIHLVNSKNGTLKRVNNDALYEIEAMASVGNMEVYNKFLEVGTQIHPTIDIKTDAGWIQLVNPDAEIFDADFQRIIELMPTLFEIEEESD
jgi:biotin carboxylase